MTTGSTGSTGLLRVAVVQGGPSSEAEVSRASAKGVTRALEDAGHVAIRLELGDYLPESLRTGAYDAVFPVVHGAVGEDGSLQGLLEVLELPYVGSGVLASALAMNKAMARRIFASVGLPIARGFSVRVGELDASAVADRALASLPAGLVVKPAESGSAIGIGRFPERPGRDELVRAVDRAFSLGPDIVIEAFVAGAEATCGVLEGDDGPRALPPTEIRAPNDVFYSFEARYAPGRSVHVCPADLGGHAALVQSLAVRAHRALGCRDLCRVDFLVGADPADPVTVLEVNTLPGLTATSLLPEEAAAAGVSFSEMCDRLVRRAHARGASRRNSAVPFPGGV